MLSAPIKNSKAVLEKMIGQRKEEAEDDDMDWDEDVWARWRADDDDTVAFQATGIPTTI